MKINSLMEDLRILNIRAVNVFLFGGRIYSGVPVNLPDKFNLDVTSVTRHPRQNIVDVVLGYDLREDTKAPKAPQESQETEVKEETKMSNLEKLKSFLAVKIDDIDDCRETLEVFGCLDSSPNIKSKVSDYLNGKQDAFVEILDFLDGSETDKEEHS
jgi:hypothetical protein